MDTLLQMILITIGNLLNTSTLGNSRDVLSKDSTIMINNSAGDYFCMLFDNGKVLWNADFGYYKLCMWNLRVQLVYQVFIYLCADGSTRCYIYITNLYNGTN